MENSIISGESENPNLETSQKTCTTPTSCSGNGNPINGNFNRSSPTIHGSNEGGGGGALPPLTPKTISRSEPSNPYPTTFIQADTSSFKQVVQMLTGSAETAAKHVSPPQQQQPKPVVPGPKKPAFKLYERRNNSFKKISPLVSGFFHPNSLSNPNSPITTSSSTSPFYPRYKPEILSPSILDLPSLVLSPVTPLSRDPFNRNHSSSSLSSSSMSSSPPGGGDGCVSAEDRAISEKGFYLHPSPRNSDPPQLLPLFPITSPSGKGM